MVKLEDFTNTELKAIARKYNKVAKIAGYSKLKKDELIKKIRGHPNLNVSETDKGVKIKVVGSDLGNVDKVIKEKKPRKPREPKKKEAEKKEAEKKEEPKKEEKAKITFEEAENRFKKIKKIFVELEKGLNQEQLKSFNNEVREYNKLVVNTYDDTATATIKRNKNQLHKDYKKLYKIFLGIKKPKKIIKKKEEPKKKEEDMTEKDKYEDELTNDYPFKDVEEFIKDEYEGMYNNIKNRSKTDKELKKNIINFLVSKINEKRFVFYGLTNQQKKKIDERRKKEKELQDEEYKKLPKNKIGEPQFSKMKNPPIKNFTKDPFSGQEKIVTKRIIEENDKRFNENKPQIRERNEMAKILNKELDKEEKDRLDKRNKFINNKFGNYKNKDDEGKMKIYEKVNKYISDEFEKLEKSNKVIPKNSQVLKDLLEVEYSLNPIWRSISKEGRSKFKDREQKLIRKMRGFQASFRRNNTKIAKKEMEDSKFLAQNKNKFDIEGGLNTEEEKNIRIEGTLEKGMMGEKQLRLKEENKKSRSDYLKSLDKYEKYLLNDVLGNPNISRGGYSGNQRKRMIVRCGKNDYYLYDTKARINDDIDKIDNLITEYKLLKSGKHNLVVKGETKNKYAFKIKTMERVKENLYLIRDFTKRYDKGEFGDCKKKKKEGSFYDFYQKEFNSI